MTRSYDILIFSLFGRNHWLAAQLKSLGLRVALFDLSPLYQKGLAEDWEGPFPLIFPDSVARSNSQSFTEQDQCELLHRGPSLRIKGKGLLEFKAEHTPYLLDKWNQTSLWFKEEESLKTVENPKKEILDLNTMWLKQFLKQWRSTTLRPLSDVNPAVEEFPLNSNYLVRHSSRRGFIDSVSWLKDSGVDILPSSSWFQCQYKDGKWILELEQGAVKVEAKKFVNGITSYEAHRFSGQIDYPGAELKTPSAFWVRWKGTCSETEKLEYLPTYSMFLTDKELGSINENLIILIKRAQGDLDVWACLSKEVLSQLSFHENIQSSIKEKIKSYVPELQDIELESLRLGADLFSFWPLYDDIENTIQNKLNMIIDSPEAWTGLDNYSRYIHQLYIIDQMNKEFFEESGATK